MSRSMIAITTALLVLTGCASSPPSRFFSLTPLPPAPGTTSSASSSLSVGVGPVKLPSLVDRPQMVTSTGPYERHLAEFARWAEPLPDNVSHVLTENMAVLLATDAVVSLPTLRDLDLDYRIPISIAELSLEPGGNAVLSARWGVIDQHGNRRATRHTRLTVPSPSDDPSDMARILSGLLADLAREITLTLKVQG